MASEEQPRHPSGSGPLAGGGNSPAGPARYPSPANPPAGGSLQPLYDKPSPVPTAPRRGTTHVPAPPPLKGRRRFVFFGRRDRADGLTADRERELMALCR